MVEIKLIFPTDIKKILYFLPISRKTGALAKAVQKIDFLGPNFRGLPGE